MDKKLSPKNGVQKVPRWSTVILTGFLFFCLIAFGFLVMTLFNAGIFSRNSSSTFSMTDASEDEFENAPAEGLVDDTDSAIVPEDEFVPFVGTSQQGSSKVKDGAVVQDGRADTADWKTFDSRKMPISFSYPDDWTIWEGSTPLSDYVQIGDYVAQTGGNDAFTGKVPGHKLEATVIELELTGSLEQWIKEANSNFFDMDSVTKDILVDGFPAKLDYLVLGESIWLTIYIPLGDNTNRIVTISVSGPEESFEELEPFLNAFLSTVKVKG